eukprot:CAMPEP_0115239228 /NCGR_PEP_ID=MMETSP0270-20121206/37290_1 /TAXON_ID=71861 /ORGANISM="Scrippsiella trochoidea, Strain CCMP3099" /LENGTH=321 /DNA_ID=CAMNT_0002654179 /DNA_START=248 /DNA_END=1213 /DNA_ORIENTATION=+
MRAVGFASSTPPHLPSPCENGGSGLCAKRQSQRANATRSRLVCPSYEKLHIAMTIHFASEAFFTPWRTALPASDNRLERDILSWKKIFALVKTMRFLSWFWKDCSCIFKQTEAEVSFSTVLMSLSLLPSLQTKDLLGTSSNEVVVALRRAVGMPSGAVCDLGCTAEVLLDLPPSTLAARMAETNEVIVEDLGLLRHLPLETDLLCEISAADPTELLLTDRLLEDRLLQDLFDEDRRVEFGDNWGDNPSSGNVFSTRSPPSTSSPQDNTEGRFSLTSSSTSLSLLKLLPKDEFPSAPHGSPGSSASTTPLFSSLVLCSGTTV